MNQISDELNENNESEPSGNNDGEEAAMTTTEKQVTTFLREHPEFLERFVLTNVKIETIDKWRVKKAKRDSGKGKDAGR